jgi:hypothetical protein
VGYHVNDQLVAVWAQSLGALVMASVAATTTAATTAAAVATAITAATAAISFGRSR